jgi:hypothetical protein
MSGKNINGLQKSAEMTYAEFLQYARTDELCIVTDSSTVVNPLNIVSITGDGTTVNVLIDTPTIFNVGDEVIVRDTSSYNGRFEITAVNSTTQFEYSDIVNAGTQSGTVNFINEKNDNAVMAITKSGKVIVVGTGASSNGNISIGNDGTVQASDGNGAFRETSIVDLSDTTTLTKNVTFSGTGYSFVTTGLSTVQMNAGSISIQTSGGVDNTGITLNNSGSWTVGSTFNSISNLSGILSLNAQSRVNIIPELKITTLTGTPTKILGVDDNGIVGNASVIVPTTASDLSFDNTTSSLNDTNVQDAIDSLDSKVETNKTNITNNSVAIATNSSNISTNSADIATNITNISNNTTAINTHVSNVNNPHNTSLDKLTDTSNIASAINGQVLKYNSVSGKWEPNNDSSITAEGDVLFNGTSNKLMTTDAVGNIDTTNAPDWDGSILTTPGLNITFLSGTAATLMAIDSNGNVVDGSALVPADASELPYNNVDSTLTSTDVDSALDELDSKVETNNTSISDHTSNTNNPHNTSLDNLSDTANISSATNGQVLKFNSVSGKWEPNVDSSTTTEGDALIGGTANKLLTLDASGNINTSNAPDWNGTELGITGRLDVSGFITSQDDLYLDSLKEKTITGKGNGIAVTFNPSLSSVSSYINLQETSNTSQYYMDGSNESYYTGMTSEISDVAGVSGFSRTTISSNKGGLNTAEIIISTGNTSSSSQVDINADSVLVNGVPLGSPTDYVTLATDQEVTGTKTFSVAQIFNSTIEANNNILVNSVIKLSTASNGSPSVGDMWYQTGTTNIQSAFTIRGNPATLTLYSTNTATSDGDTISSIDFYSSDASGTGGPGVQSSVYAKNIGDGSRTQVIIATTSDGPSNISDTLIIDSQRSELSSILKFNDSTNTSAAIGDVWYESSNLNFELDAIFNGRVRNQINEIDNTTDAYITTSDRPIIYASSGTGAGKFSESGNLIIQPRMSTGRDVIISTQVGVNSLVIDRNGIVDVNNNIKLSSSLNAPTGSPVVIARDTDGTLVDGTSLLDTNMTIGNSISGGTPYAILFTDASGNLGNSGISWNNALKFSSTLNPTSSDGDIWLDTTSGNLSIKGTLDLIDKTLFGSTYVDIIDSTSWGIRIDGINDSLRPITTETSSLGISSHRFTDLYLSNKVNIASSTNSTITNGDVWLDSTSGEFIFRENGESLVLGSIAEGKQTSGTTNNKILTIDSNGDINTSNSPNWNGSAIGLPTVTYSSSNNGELWSDGTNVLYRQDSNSYKVIGYSTNNGPLDANDYELGESTTPVLNTMLNIPSDYISSTSTAIIKTSKPSSSSSFAHQTFQVLDGTNKIYYRTKTSTWNAWTQLSSDSSGNVISETSHFVKAGALNQAYEQLTTHSAFGTGASSSGTYTGAINWTIKEVDIYCQNVSFNTASYKIVLEVIDIDTQYAIGTGTLLWETTINPGSATINNYSRNFSVNVNVPNDKLVFAYIQLVSGVYTMVDCEVSVRVEAVL